MKMRRRGGAKNMRRMMPLILPIMGLSALIDSFRWRVTENWGFSPLPDALYIGFHKQFIYPSLYTNLGFKTK